MAKLKVYGNQIRDLNTPPKMLVLFEEKHDSVGICEQFAQEGYEVVRIRLDKAHYGQDVNDAIEILAHESGTSFGMLTYEVADGHCQSLQQLAKTVHVKGVVHYTPAMEDGLHLILKDQDGTIIPTVLHLASSQDKLHASLLPFLNSAHCRSCITGPPVSLYTYPLVSELPSFALVTKAPALMQIAEAPELTLDLPIRSAISLSYTRTLALFRKTIGPWFDLEKLWEQHCQFEFVDRDATKTMATMVDTPYVNHIPTMTGGIGNRDLSLFYKHHFIESSPPDTEIIPISRTVGVDRLVDEFLFRFTHTTEVDYLLPGIKPTGKRVEIPMIGVIAFRGDKLTFEHIYWDQASTLVQLGLLDPSGLPTAGVDVAHKMVNPFTFPSNTLLEKWKDTNQLDS